MPTPSHQANKQTTPPPTTKRKGLFVVVNATCYVDQKNDNGHGNGNGNGNSNGNGNRSRFCIFCPQLLCGQWQRPSQRHKNQHFEPVSADNYLRSGGNTPLVLQLSRSVSQPAWSTWRVLPLGPPLFAGLLSVLLRASPPEGLSARVRLWFLAAWCWRHSTTRTTTDNYQNNKTTTATTTKTAIVNTYVHPDLTIVSTWKCTHTDHHESNCKTGMLRCCTTTMVVLQNKTVGAYSITASSRNNS